jgi:hypothetical protein
VWGQGELGGPHVIPGEAVMVCTIVGGARSWVCLGVGSTNHHNRGLMGSGKE